MDFEKLTPMMKQYVETKNKYKDCILFFRLGDFYEMFFEDALLASKTLEITLTKKSCGLEEKAPMCGVPYHSASNYIQKLVEHGFKVAIAEQMGDPQTSKGLVSREVVEVITPGTLLEGNLLDNKKNNYLLSIYIEKENSSLSFVDITTGEIHLTKLKKDKIIEEIAKISPSEIIVNDIDFYENLENISLMSNIYLNKNFEERYLENEIIENYFNKEYIDYKDLDLIMKNSLSVLLNYVFYTQKKATQNINSINVYNSFEYMTLDIFTRNNLELTSSMNGKNKKGTLLNILDKTNTSMGARLLRKCVEEPLISKDKIEERLLTIEEIKDDYMLRVDLIEILKEIYDIERICGKVAFEKVTPKELINLKYSLSKLPHLKGLINSSGAKKLKEIINDLDEMKDLYELIEKSIVDEPSISIKDGNIIKDDFNVELKEFRDISKNGAYIIKEIENKEKELTNIKTLKVGFNKVFGYFIEITKANLVNQNLGDRYIRKQTLSNAERYITEELKIVEEKILNAEDKIKILEYNLFVEIRNEVYKNILKLQKISKIIANIDVVTSLSTVAYENNYIKPSINEDNIIEIRDGRHPVIETLVSDFISNDTTLDDSVINIITGPNMAGKSTYMRQVALISLMAHIGSFVPASFANISVLDRIFTRVGASDDLSQGKSTFMVEMSEVSQILQNATNKSLIILDEVGRGTSTYDGISLAWSIVEYIKENIKAKTLFATHYHELTELENEYAEIKNYSVLVKEENEEVVFLRKIVEGCANKSYGIHVAKLAKLPQKLLERSSEILNNLEKNHNQINIKESSINSSVVKEKIEYEKDYQIEFAIKEENSEYKDISNDLINLDLMNMTPLEMINVLYNLQKKAKNNEN
ncbi:MAG: DNA mismatch repair protein MutS [Peptostreptococcaceae bacterium]